MSPAKPASSREAIERLVFAYARCVDSGDFAGLGDLFASGTLRADTTDGPAVFKGRGVQRLLESLVITYDDGTPRTKHVTTNLVVEVDEATGTAAARSYYTVFQAVPGLALQPIIAGHYDDRFVRDGEAWRFADRYVWSDLVGDVSHHLRTNPYE